MATVAPTFSQAVTIDSGKRWGEITVNRTGATDAYYSAVASFNDAQPAPLSTVVVYLPATTSQPARVRIVVGLAAAATANTSVTVNVWQRGGTLTPSPKPDPGCALFDSDVSDETTDAPPAKKRGVGKSGRGKKGKARG